MLEIGRQAKELRVVVRSIDALAESSTLEKVCSGDIEYFKGSKNNDGQQIPENKDSRIETMKS